MTFSPPLERRRRRWRRWFLIGGGAVVGFFILWGVAASQKDAPATVALVPTPTAIRSGEPAEGGGDATSEEEDEDDDAREPQTDLSGPISLAAPAPLHDQLRAAAESLAAEDIAHRADVRLGIMIETPAAAVTADLLAHEAAFFSVGSNDLTQYAMAADRGAAELATRYPHDAPAVMRLIGQAAEAAARAGIPIGVCGDLAGTLEAAPALVGLGIAELSMAPPAIPLVKERLRGLTLAEVREMARKRAMYTNGDSNR